MKATHSLVPVVAASLFLAACSSADGGPAPSAADPTPQHLASPSAASDPRVEAYLDSIYDRSRVLHSFTTTRGDAVDCVDFAAEPGVRSLVAGGETADEVYAEVKLHESTLARERGDRPLARSPFFDGQRDDAGNVRACPERTVPHVRITAEHISKAGGLDAYRASLPHAPPPPHVAPAGVAVPASNPASGGTWGPGDVPDYGHVFTYQTASPVAGGLSTMAIGPESDVNGSFIESSSNHSLAQIWIVGGSGSGTQTLEAGWEIDANVGGPYLFVGSTQDNYKDFCENGEMALGTTSCVTWVSNPGTTLFPSGPLSASVTGGAQHELTISVTHNCYFFDTPCNWDVEATEDGTTYAFLGYYVDSGYGTGALASDEGDVFETGGEVLDESGTFTDVNMGEGSLFLGGASYGTNAYVHDFGYYQVSCRRTIDPTRCSNPLQQGGATVYTTRSEFTYNTTAAAGSSSWSNWFYYGDYRGFYIPIPIHLGG